MVDKLKLLMGKPIQMDDKGLIFAYQPLVKDIVDIGEDKFRKFVTVYTVTSEFVFNGLENDEELSKKYNIFEMFFLKDKNGENPLDKTLFGGEKALDVLRESLIYFFHTDNINILENRKKIVIRDSYLLDINEFKKLRKVIQDIVCSTDIDFEKVPKNMSKRKLDIWLKLQNGRRRDAEQKAVYLQDIINFTMFGGNSFIPIREIEQMTYYELNNAYKSIMGIDSYYTNLQYKLSPKYEIKEKIPHWTDNIKIGK